METYVFDPQPCDERKSRVMARSFIPAHWFMHDLQIGLRKFSQHGRSGYAFKSINTDRDPARWNLGPTLFTGDVRRFGLFTLVRYGRFGFFTIPTS